MLILSLSQGSGMWVLDVDLGLIVGVDSWDRFLGSRMWGHVGSILVSIASDWKGAEFGRCSKSKIPPFDF